MRYYVLKKEFGINDQTIVGFVRSKEELIEKVKEKYPQSIYSDKSFDEINKDLQCLDGLYIVVVENSIILFEKSITISTGYIYNSTYIIMKELTQWNLLPYEFDMQFNSDNIIENIIEHTPIYEMDNLPKYPSIYIIGDRGSGKKFITYDIINYYLKNPDSNILIITNYFTKNNYVEKYSNIQIEEGFNKNVFCQFLDYQESRNKDNQEKPGLIIFDIPLRIDQFELKEMTDILYNNARYHTAFVMVIQYPIQFNQKLQENIDLIFLTKDEYKIHQEKLFEFFGKQFQSFSIFKEVFTNFTKNKGALVINNSHKTNNIYQKLFRYNSTTK